jgi:hypothetical protein
MKPKEFDELVRQKFDQNDFAYSPQNWDQLAEQMDGRTKKRGMYMWLGIPLAGMAASVAMAMGINFLMKHDAAVAPSMHPGIAKVATQPKAATPQASLPLAEAVGVTTAMPAAKTNSNPHTYQANNKNKHTQNATAAQVTPKAADGFAIRMHDNATNIKGSINDLAFGVKEKINTGKELPIAAKEKTNTENKRKINVFNDWYDGLIDESARKVSPGISLSLAGGVNYGRQNSGYMAGASIRKMVNEKVYVEGGVAFTSNSSVQKTQYMVYDETPQTTASFNGAAAKTSGRVDTVASRVIPPPAPSGTLKEHDIAYNLYYVQVTPSLGYKLLKKLSIGGGADFQKALVDNRPELSTVDRGNLQVAPMFDVGLIGKTEYAIAKRVTAAVYYRKGINNVITPTNKYIDRDYLQFQVKCTIFDK